MIVTIGITMMVMVMMGKTMVMVVATIMMTVMGWLFFSIKHEFYERNSTYAILPKVLKMRFATYRWGPGPRNVRLERNFGWLPVIAASCGWKPSSA